MKNVFTSEYVTYGHPDKVADIISDSILDCFLDEDPKSRVACETLVVGDKVIVAGEITLKRENANIEDIVRNAIRDIGYTYDDMKFNADKVQIFNYLNKQSPDISMGVDVNGAGDQGIMFGCAYRGIDDETFMPDCWKFARDLGYRLQDLQKEFPGVLRPDGKTQVTIDYTNKALDTIVVSCAHDSMLRIQEVRDFIKSEVIERVCDKYYNKIKIDGEQVKYHINPTGRFVICGPDGDTGLTGRKIVVDGYGGFCPVGGGAFSGKDGTKVDRTGAYLARYLALNLLHSKWCEDEKYVQVQLGYAIGVPAPVSIRFSPNSSKYEKVIDWIQKNVPMDPASLIAKFDLRREKKLFKYSDLAKYGHFGRTDVNLPWEQLDLIDELNKI